MKFDMLYTVCLPKSADKMLPCNSVRIWIQYQQTATCTELSYHTLLNWKIQMQEKTRANKQIKDIR